MSWKLQEGRELQGLLVPLYLSSWSQQAVASAVTPGQLQKPQGLPLGLLGPLLLPVWYEKSCPHPEDVGLEGLSLWLGFQDETAPSLAP